MKNLVVKEVKFPEKDFDWYPDMMNLRDKFFNGPYPTPIGFRRVIRQFITDQIKWREPVFAQVLSEAFNLIIAAAKLDYSGPALKTREIEGFHHCNDVFQAEFTKAYECDKICQADDFSKSRRSYLKTSKKEQIDIDNLKPLMISGLPEFQKNV